MIFENTDCVILKRVFKCLEPLDPCGAPFGEYSIFRDSNGVNRPFSVNLVRIRSRLARLRLSSGEVTESSSISLYN